MSQAGGRVDDRITLETVGKCSDRRKRETDISGNAGNDQVLARLNSVDETLLVPDVD
jgi:hypothetical protein